MQLIQLFRWFVVLSMVESRTRSVCRHGDKRGFCVNIGKSLPLSLCYKRFHHCCDTCTRLRIGNPECPYGDRAKWCRQLGKTRPLAECYDHRKRNRCCHTCEKLKLNIAGCPYGDQESSCVDIGPHYVVASCYERENICCDTCHRLKNAIPDCMYGDREIWCNLLGTKFDGSMCNDDSTRIPCCGTCYRIHNGMMTKHSTQSPDLPVIDNHQKSTTPVFNASTSPPPSFTPLDKATPALTTPEKSTPAFTPLKKSTPAFTPPQKSTPEFTPPQKSTPAFTPPQKSTPAFTPPDKTTPAFAPPETLATAESADSVPSFQKSSPLGVTWSATSELPFTKNNQSTDSSSANPLTLVTPAVMKVTPAHIPSSQKVAKTSTSKYHEKSIINIKSSVTPLINVQAVTDRKIRQSSTSPKTVSQVAQNKVINNKTESTSPAAPVHHVSTLLPPANLGPGFQYHLPTNATTNILVTDVIPRDDPDAKGISSANNKGSSLAAKISHTTPALWFLPTLAISVFPYISATNLYG